MGNKYLDTKFVDSAINFAVEKHKDQERNGKGSPYVLHVLEAASIVETMTSDKELIAAAILHDTIEDTDASYEEISEKFGKRVADLVDSETSLAKDGTAGKGTWEERKQQTLDKLKSASYEGKIVALGDKLSNARVMYRDYYEIGDKLWEKFHMKDVRKHEWYYRGLVDALSELENLPAYIDFKRTVNKLFLKAVREVEIKKEGSKIRVSGHLREGDIASLSQVLDGDIEYRLDFERVGHVSLSAIRSLIDLRSEGKKFYIANLEEGIYTRFAEAGALGTLSILEVPRHINMESLTLLGGGFNGESYKASSGETLIKLYAKGADIRLAENEKRCSEKVFGLGIPTPISGSLVECRGRIGICYEIVKGKKSIARALADSPENAEELAKLYASMLKKLHSTKCDTDFFPSIKEKYIREIEKVDFVSEKDKEKILDFVKSVPDMDICAHGDLQIGNIIFAGEKTLFIDLGDFSFGNPEFDLSTFYFINKYLAEDVVYELYHVKKDLMAKFYEAFEREYYDEKPDEDRLNKMAAVRGLTYASLVGPKREILDSLKAGFNIDGI